MEGIVIDATELSEVLGIPINESDLDTLNALWSLYRFGLEQMDAELEGSDITTWLGLDHI